MKLVNDQMRQQVFNRCRQVIDENHDPLVMADVDDLVWNDVWHQIDSAVMSMVLWAVWNEIN